MKMRELFNSPKAWTKEFLAVDEEGQPADVKKGVAFCLLGAASRCYPNYFEYVEVTKKIDNYINEHFPHPAFDDNEVWLLSTFNDSRNTDFSKIRQIVEDLDI